MTVLYCRSLSNVILATQDSVDFTSGSHADYLARFPPGAHVRSNCFEKVPDVFGIVL